MHACSKYAKTSHHILEAPLDFTISQNIKSSEGLLEARASLKAGLSLTQSLTGSHFSKHSNAGDVGDAGDACYAWQSNYPCPSCRSWKLCMPRGHGGNADHSGHAEHGGYV